MSRLQPFTRRAAVSGTSQSGSATVGEAERTTREGIRRSQQPASGGDPAWLSPDQATGECEGFLAGRDQAFSDRDRTASDRDQNAARSGQKWRRGISGGFAELHPDDGPMDVVAPDRDLLTVPQLVFGVIRAVTLDASTACSSNLRSFRPALRSWSA